MSDHDTRPFKSLRIYCDASSVAVVAVGCLVLIGWVFHNEYLKSVIPGFATLKVNTELCLTFSGTSLWLLLTVECRNRRGHMAGFLSFRGLDDGSGHSH